MAGLMIDGWGTNLMNVGNATGEIRNTTEKSMQFDLIWEHAQAATGPKCMLFTSSCSHLHGLTSFLCVPELCAMWSPLVCLLPSFLFSPKTVTVGVIGSHRYRDCYFFLILEPERHGILRDSLLTQHVKVIQRPHVVNVCCLL